MTTASALSQNGLPFLHTASTQREQSAPQLSISAIGFVAYGLLRKIGAKVLHNT